MAKRLYSDDERRERALVRQERWRRSKGQKPRAPRDPAGGARRSAAFRERHLEAELRYHRNWHLQKKYRITLEEFEAMIEAQDGRCAICSIGLEAGNGRAGAHVDHDHDTGRVRGALCGNCNRGLGMFSDSRAVVERALAYLK